jgi:membrane protease YdiL (CAAX protease family)
MKNIQNTSPIIFAIFTLLAISIIVLLPIDIMLIKMSVSDFHSEYIGLTFKMTLIFIISYRLIRNMKIESVSGLSSKFIWKFKYLNMVPVYLIVLGIVNIVSKDISQIQMVNLLLVLVACLAVGFAEEFLFRGVLQSVFLKKYLSHKMGILTSVLIPAIVFGLFHLINLTKNDDVIAVLIQAIFATFIGFFFGVLVLKTNKLIPVAITHGLINFFFSIPFLPGIEETITIEETGTSIAPIILTLPLFIIGFLALRKVRKEDVFNKLNEHIN